MQGTVTALCFSSMNRTTAPCVAAALLLALGSSGCEDPVASDVDAIQVCGITTAGENRKGSLGMNLHATVVKANISDTVKAGATSGSHYLYEVPARSYRTWEQAQLGSDCFTFNGLAGGEDPETPSHDYGDLLLYDEDGNEHYAWGLADDAVVKEVMWMTSAETPHPHPPKRSAEIRSQKLKGRVLKVVVAFPYFEAPKSL